jgi:hypothetical protein
MTRSHNATYHTVSSQKITIAPYSTVLQTQSRQIEKNKGRSNNAGEVIEYMYMLEKDNRKGAWGALFESMVQACRRERLSPKPSLNDLDTYIGGGVSIPVLTDVAIHLANQYPCSTGCTLSCG